MRIHHDRTSSSTRSLGVVLVGLGLLVGGACDSGTDTEAGPPGDYTLQMVNGESLPAELAIESFGCEGNVNATEREIVSGGSLTLGADGSGSMTLDSEVECVLDGEVVGTRDVGETISLDWFQNGAELTYVLASGPVVTGVFEESSATMQVPPRDGREAATYRFVRPGS